MSRAVAALLTLSFLAAVAGAGGAQTREAPLAEGRRALSIQGERYGIVPPDDTTVQRARSVFERVVRAAGRRPGLAFDLTVLDTPRVVGQALPGGLVVVSRGLLDLTAADDSALAFVLAHELAHLLRDHHAALPWRLLGAGQGVPPEHAQAYQEKELEADRLGVLFATLAGYQPTTAIAILQKVAADTRPDRLHPSPRARADAIAAQLADVGAHLEVLHLGLFLLGMRQYHDAALVLEQFIAVFPAREILSLAGTAWHKEALRHAPASPYQHLLVVDASTRALRLRGDQGFTPPPPDPEMQRAFRRAIDRAVTLYKQAVEADPEYAPALNNLAMAYLDLDETDLALAYVTRALKANSHLASAYNNRGIVRALAGDGRRAEEDWLRALQLEPGRPEIIANLARVQRNADDAKAWRARLPAPDRSVHVMQSFEGLGPGTSLERVRVKLTEPRARTIAVPLGGPSEEDLALSISPGHGLLAAVRHDLAEVVAAFGSSRAVTREGLGPGDSLARVERAYGRPSVVEGVQTLNVWYYPTRGLAVFAVGDRVQAIWGGRPTR